MSRPKMVTGLGEFSKPLPHSAETRAKISAAQKGKESPGLSVTAVAERTSRLVKLIGIKETAKLAGVNAITLLGVLRSRGSASIGTLAKVAACLPAVPK